MISRLTWMLLLVMACSGPSRQRKRDPLRDPLAEAAALMEQRADPARLDEAVAAYERLYERAPGDRRVVAGAARARLARAVGYPGRDPEDLARARELGFACVLLRREVREAAAARGGRLDPESFGSLVAVDLPCVEVAARAWLRWLEARGAGGASIDLPVVQALVDRELALAGPEPGVHALRDEALAWALPPAALGADLERADGAFTAAAREAPERRRIPVDRARHILAARGEEAAWRGTLELVAGGDLDEGAPLLMENRAARDLARELLDAGMPRVLPPAL